MLIGNYIGVLSVPNVRLPSTTKTSTVEKSKAKTEFPDEPEKRVKEITPNFKSAVMLESVINTYSKRYTTKWSTKILEVNEKTYNLKKLPSGK